MIGKSTRFHDVVLKSVMMFYYHPTLRLTDARNEAKPTVVRPNEPWVDRRFTLGAILVPAFVPTLFVSVSSSLRQRPIALLHVCVELALKREGFQGQC